MNFISIGDDEFLNLAAIATFRMKYLDAAPDPKTTYLSPFDAPKPEGEFSVDLVLVTGRQIALTGERAKSAITWLTHRPSQQQTPPV